MLVVPGRLVTTESLVAVCCVSVPAFSLVVTSVILTLSVWEHFRLDTDEVVVVLVSGDLEGDVLDCFFGNWINLVERNHCVESHLSEVQQLGQKFFLSLSDTCG